MFSKMEVLFTTNLVIMFVMKELKHIIKSEMEKRGLSIRGFSRLVGVSHPTLSDILNGEEPSFDVCRKLAPVLNLPLEQILRAAGLFPSLLEEDEQSRRVDYLFSQLDPEGQRQALDYLAFLAEKYARKEEPAATRQPRRSPRPSESGA